MGADMSVCTRDILDGLRKCGFKLNMGTLDSGFALSAWDRGGGYYIGACISRSSLLSIE
jgi:hypothetical protein